jgi:guanine nucleotide-binding protein G(I)/G(S)/G(T) subunit beta-1
MRRALKGHFGKVMALHWAGDSHLLVSASQDGNLLIWNTVSNNKIQSLSLKSSYVMAVGIEQTKGNLVACGGLDNLCTVYRRNAPDQAVEMASHDGFLSCCRFLSEKEILTSSGDSTIIRWDVPTGKPVDTFAEHTADAMFIALKPGDKNVFASCSVDLTTKIWDIRTPKMAVQTFKGHSSDINAVEFMPSDPNCFATCGQDNTVRLYDMRSYNEINCFGKETRPSGTEMPTDGFTCLSISKSGRLIFCGHSDGNVQAFDVLSEKGSGPAYSLVQAHEKHISCMGMSPAGDALCTGSWDGLLKIWA